VFSDFSGFSIDHNLFTGKAQFYGSNHILDNPEFINPHNNDFHLQSFSPCIDTGSNTLAPMVDFDQNTRPQGTYVDIGPYEFCRASPTCTVTVSCNGQGDIYRIPQKTEYQQGEIVEFIALPDDGWVFDHWEQDITGTENPITIIITDDMIVTAVFTEDEDQETIVISNHYPSDRVSQVPVKRPFLYAEIENSCNTPISWLITTSPDVGTSQGTLIDGPVCCLLQTLEYNTSYVWTIHLETENGWQNMSYLFSTEQEQKTSIHVLTEYIYRYFSWFYMFFRIMI